MCQGCLFSTNVLSNNSQCNYEQMLRKSSIIRSHSVKDVMRRLSTKRVYPILRFHGKMFMHFFIEGRTNSTAQFSSNFSQLIHYFIRLDQGSIKETHLCHFSNIENKFPNSIYDTVHTFNVEIYCIFKYPIEDLSSNKRSEFELSFCQLRQCSASIMLL